MNKELDLDEAKFKLPSGSELGAVLAPFEDGQRLFEVVMEHAKALNIDESREIDHQFYKDIASVALSSKEMRDAILTCAKRSKIGGARFTMDHFENKKTRMDYVPCLTYVAMVNLEPFSKGLFAMLKSEHLQELFESLLK